MKIVKENRMGEYYDCECNSECINVERSIDIFEKNKKHPYYVQIFFAIYHYGTQNHRPIFREKIRHCWQILKTGKNFADNIILSSETAKKLGKDLLKLSSQKEIDKEVKDMIKKGEVVR